MIVVDAGVLAVALVDDNADGDLARDRLRDHDLIAPALIDLEVMSVCRGLVRGGRLTRERAELAVTQLISLPLTRVDHAPLVARCWELRDNLTPYDAAYVALAETLGVPLLTSDERLGRAPGIRCAVEVLSVGR